MIFPSCPEDSVLLQELGKVSIAHSQLDYSLLLLVKSLKNLALADAQRDLGRVSSFRLREIIEEYVEEHVLDICVKEEILNYLEAAKALTKIRNDLVHGVWAQELDGDAFIYRPNKSKELSIPSIRELKILSKNLFQLANDINRSRLEGEISRNISP
jgi:predicted DNA-binding protein